MSERPRSSKNRRQRRGRLVAASTAVGAFLTFGAAPLAVAPAAHADLDDLFWQPVAEAVEQVVNLLDPGLLDDSGADSLAASALDTADPTGLSDLDATLDSWFAGLFGDTGDSDDAHAGIAEATGTDPVPTSAEAPSDHSIDLQVNGGTEPVVDVSVGGGQDASVLVDTGSNGLVVPWQYVDWSNVDKLGDFGMGAYGTGGGGLSNLLYGDGLAYFYVTVPTTVEFGDNGDLTTGTTDVNVELFAFPTTLHTLLAGRWTIEDFLGAHANGILGIGGNASGPSDSNPIEALPGDLGKGVLIDQANHTMTFGTNPLEGGTAIDGSPKADLWVQVGDGGDLHKVSAVMDSGGVYGTIPGSVAGVEPGQALAPGTVVNVYSSDDADQTPLYSYTVDASHSPAVTAGDSMNTGNWLFQQNPVYIGVGGHGSTYVGGTLAGQ